MNFRLRPVLSVFLLLLFSLEIIAPSATTDPGKNVPQKSISATIEIQPFLALLAEESIERDNKDNGDIETYLSEVDLAFGSTLLPAAVGIALKNTAGLRGSVSSALYKFFCSFLL